ncbi:transporter substrate-binding domain-containing protein [candidate division GN15 bacterium]|nr:transporter substrate-binding domain-containing protein [candidate division GN15 bacterium]
MRIRSVLCLFILCVFAAGSLVGQTVPDRELVVGTKETVPFVIKNPDGSWRGISIELWQDIADQLGLQYRFEERDLEGLLEGLRDTTLDVVAAAITVTPEREAEVDFSHPFYTTGLTIAVSSEGKSGWLSMLSRLLSVEFLTAIGALLVLLVVIGLIVWLFERRRNPEEFGGSFLEGLGSGVWWSAVTMTTVGYGDKTPKTFLGRIVGLIWMFAAIIVVSGFTAAIASSLTVSQLESGVRGPADLPYVSVGSIPNSTSGAYLSEQGVAYAEYTTPLAGLQAVARGDIEAFVYDAPILRYLAKTKLAGRVQILPVTFFRQDYAIGLPQDSHLREPINRALLNEIQLPEWKEILDQYLGE